MNTAAWWLLLNIFSLIVLSFYSMMEMACVSFNKVRLQYYVSKGQKRAIWLNYLLHHPSRLFGTTLIAVNLAMVFGSECARRFHLAIGVNPDLAPLSQVIVVVIFGELAPMFAARTYSENVALLGAPLVYASAKLMTPVLWLIGKISELANKLVGGAKNRTKFFLGRDELQRILEETDEDHHTAVKGSTEDLNLIVTNIFNLRDIDVGQIMEPLDSWLLLPSTGTVLQLRKILQNTSSSYYFLIYHQNPANIVGIVTPRDLLRAPDNAKVRDYSRSPWFITKNTKILHILKQFRSNKQRVAVVLNEKGQAGGILTFDDALEEIFGSINILSTRKGPQPFIERSFPGYTKVADFNAKFGVNLHAETGVETLAELIVQTLGHQPEVGEAVYIAPFELTVKEASLLEIKAITVKTRTT